MADHRRRSDRQQELLSIALRERRRDSVVKRPADEQRPQRQVPSAEMDALSDYARSATPEQRAALEVLLGVDEFLRVSNK